MVAVVRRSVEENIPVVIIDSGLANQDIIVKYVATNNYNGGWLAAKHLLQVLSAEGKTAPRLILFRYQIGSESTDQREKGFEDYVKREIDRQKQAGEKKTVTIVSDDKYAGATKETASKEATPLLNKLRGQVDGIFAPNESSASGMLDSLRSLDLNRGGGNKKGVHLMGFDSSKPLLDAVEKGDIDGLILQDPYKMGYLGVWVMVHYLEGYDVAREGKVMSTGEHVITRENLKARSTEELFDPDLQGERTIAAPVYRHRRK
jgi:ribose transport system substrate-binding protein